eukprot:s4131_g5.t1
MAHGRRPQLVDGAAAVGDLVLAPAATGPGDLQCGPGCVSEKREMATCHAPVASLGTGVAISNSAAGAADLRALALVGAPGPSESQDEDVVSYNSAISSCSDWSQALQLLDEAQAVGLQLDVISSNAAIASLGSSGLAAWPLALAQLRRIATGVTTVTVNAVMGACDQWHQILPMFQRLQQWQLRATEVTYGSLLSGYETNSQWQEALSFLRKFQELPYQATAIPFNAVISACGKCAMWQHALELFQAWIALDLREMRSQVLHPSDVTINSCITAFAFGGQWLEALQLLAAHGGEMTLQMLVIRFEGTIQAAMKLGSAGFLCGFLTFQPVPGIVFLGCDVVAPLQIPVSCFDDACDLFLLRNLCHRDIKPEHLLIKDRAPAHCAEIKLCDFATTCLYTPGEQMTEKVTTPYYASPQVHEGLYSEALDAWSCGVVMYLLLTGYPRKAKAQAEFPNMKGDDFRKALTKGKMHSLQERGTHISLNAHDLLDKLLMTSEEHRYTPKQAMKNTWLMHHAPQHAAEEEVEPGGGLGVPGYCPDRAGMCF